MCPAPPYCAADVTITTPAQDSPPPVVGTLSNGFTFPAVPEHAKNWKGWTRPAGLPAPAATETWNVTVY